MIKFYFHKQIRSFCKSVVSATADLLKQKRVLCSRCYSTSHAMYLSAMYLQINITAWRSLRKCRHYVLSFCFTVSQYLLRVVMGQSTGGKMARRKVASHHAGPQLAEAIRSDAYHPIIDPLLRISNLGCGYSPCWL